MNLSWLLQTPASLPHYEANDSAGNPSIIVKNLFMENKKSDNNQRRQFLGTIASGAAVFGLSSFIAPLAASPQNNFTSGHIDPDEWFKQIKGKHRIVFDVPHPNEIFPFAWPRIFLATNTATGTPEKDCGVVVVLRHTAIPYAMEDRLWAKYNFGDVFKPSIQRQKTPQPVIRSGNQNKVIIISRVLVSFRPE